MIIMKFCKRSVPWFAMVGLLVSGLFMAGCLSRPSPGASARPVVAASSVPDMLEVFHVGDSVTVTFTDLPNIVPAFEVKVKEDGTVTLLLNQTFTFAGKTPGDLEKEIRIGYVPRYFKYMTVTVKRERQTLFYYVDGEVKMPARQTYIERTTVLKAIASAGGFTDFAKKKGVKLSRLDGRKLTINCIKAIDDSSLDVEVYPGDKVYVPRKLW